MVKAPGMKHRNAVFLPEPTFSMRHEQLRFRASNQFHIATDFGFHPRDVEGLLLAQSDPFRKAGDELSEVKDTHYNSDLVDSDPTPDPEPVTEPSDTPTHKPDLMRQMLFCSAARNVCVV